MVQRLAQPVPVPERLPDGPVQLADPHFRPIAVDKTEVTIYCIAPKGESAEARARRIRQYEDFFNATGMATPDDLEEFRSCQMPTGRAARVERHEPRRHALDQGPRRDRRRDRPEAGVSSREDRGRGPLRRPARVLAGHHAEGRWPPKPTAEAIRDRNTRGH